MIPDEFIELYYGKHKTVDLHNLTKEDARSEERRVGKSVAYCVDLGGRRIIKKNFFQAEDGIRDNGL